MSFSSLLDWLFAPVSWVARALATLAELPGLPATFWGVLICFAVATVISVSVSVIAAFAVHELLFRVHTWSEGIYRWSLHGADLKRVQAAAERYERGARLLRRARSWTGIRSEPSPRQRPQIPWPDRGAGDPRAVRACVRIALVLPTAFRMTVVGLFAWARSPVGAYLGLGSIWVVLRPDLTQPAQSVWEISRSLTTTGSLAIAGVVTAVLAVALDHGLGPRRRGRNAYLRSSSEQAEALLAAIAEPCPAVIKALDRTVDRIVESHWPVLDSALKHATGDHFHLASGIRVRAVPSETRSRPYHDFFRVDWTADQPLRRFRQSDQSPDREFDPSLQLREEIDELFQALGEDPDYRALMRQAPWDAHALLFAITWDRFQINRIREGKLLSRYQLEQAGKHLIDDIKKAQELNNTNLQRLVERRVDALNGDLWEAMQLRAVLSCFSRSVDRTRRPTGIFGRLAQRLGG